MAERYALARRLGMASGWLAALGLLVVVYLCWYYPQTTVIVLRHAEKDLTSPEVDERVPLTQPGRDRALILAQVLERAGVTAIYVTHKLRTQQTAEHLALGSGITPTQINSADTDTLIDEVRSGRNRGGVIVVINHSENIPDIVSRLGGGAVTVGGNEFDNLFVLTVHRRSGARLVKATYGAPR